MLFTSVALPVQDGFLIIERKLAGRSRVYQETSAPIFTIREPRMSMTFW